MDRTLLGNESLKLDAYLRSDLKETKHYNRWFDAKGRHVQTQFALNLYSLAGRGERDWKAH